MSTFYAVIWKVKINVLLKNSLKSNALVLLKNIKRFWIADQNKRLEKNVSKLETASPSFRGVVCETNFIE